MSKQYKIKIPTTGVYKITNPNGLVYIGQSRNIERRTELYKGAHCKLQRKLYNSIQKYGWDAHSFEIIVVLSNGCTQEELDNAEIFYMSPHKGRETSLNLREGGHRGKQSPESIAKIIAWKTGRPLPEEQKKNIGKAHKGRVYSPETIQKMSDAKKGKKQNLTPESRYKRGCTNRGKKISPETIEKMKQSAFSRWANMSEEKKEQHKKSLTGRSFSEQHIQNLSMAQKETQRKKREARKNETQLFK